MALALMWEEDSDDRQVLLGLDTGTNPFYRVLLGTATRDLDGDATLDDVYWTSPWQRNPAAGRHLRTTSGFPLDTMVVDRPRTLVQLHSAKDEAGTSSTFSSPVRLTGLAGSSPGSRPGAAAVGGEIVSLAQSRVASPVPSRPPTPTLRSPRNVPVRTARETFSRPATLDDLLGVAVRAALPLVQRLLVSASGSGAPRADDHGRTAGTVPADADSAMLELLASLLQRALGTAPAEVASSLSGFATSAPSHRHRDQPASGVASVPPLASARVAMVRPMIAGVDDALIAMLAGAVLDKLPELINAVGQSRERQLQRNHQLAQDALGLTERLRLLQLLEDQQGTADIQASGPEAELRALLQRLLTEGATVPAPTGPPVAPAAPVALSTAAGQAVTGPSLPLGAAIARARPSRAALLPVLSLAAGGGRATTAEFTVSQAITLRFRLDTGQDGPTTPLPRSILSLILHEPGGQSALATISQRIENLMPGSELRVRVPSADVAALPQDIPLEVRATLRWPGAEQTYQASTSTLVILRGPRAAYSTGTLVGDRVELTDMTRFRPFWNRLWASEGARMWGLDATVRYSVIFTAADRGNALMAAPSVLDDPRPGLRRESIGRIKSGLEASVHELNRLLPLWPGHTALAADELAPFTSPPWLAAQGGDAIVGARFEGRKGTRGLLWAVPALTLREFTIATPSEIDPFGQVLSTTTSAVSFPTIESVRFLGLVSTGDDQAPVTTSSGHSFAGYDVRFETIAGLEPAIAPATASRE